MAWRGRLADILWDQMIEQGGILDLNMAGEELRHHCPGNFALEWTHKDSLVMFEALDQERVNVVFEDDKERVEWLLKWG